jgi:CysZ protein
MTRAVGGDAGFDNPLATARDMRMGHAFVLAVGQLGDRAILRVLAKSFALTVVLLTTLGAALWFAGRELGRWLGLGSGSVLAGALALAAGIALGWLLFRAIAIAAVGLFGDEVVAAVEARHYPTARASARPVSFIQGARMGVASLVRTLLVNLLALPLYILLLATGVGTAIGFFAVNAWLLGRDLGDMVAARHMPARELAAWRGRTRGTRWLLGAAGTALLLVPFVNLVAPVLSAAMATHVYHRRPS